MGPDPKATAQAILGTAPGRAGDADPPSGEVEIDSEDAALDAFASDAFAAVQDNDAAAFRAAFKGAVRAAVG